MTAALAAQPRAIGAARVSAKLVGAAHRLADLSESGSAKIRLPRVRRGPALEAVLLNTAGGLTGGDHLRFEAEAGPGAHLEVSTQAAERAYRAQPGLVARLDARLRIGCGARLDWLPQETILFDRSALDRTLEVEMAEDATALLVESVVFGREAMGESLSEIRFRDRRRVRRGGRLVFADDFRLERDAASRLADRFALRGARAAASVLLASPDVEARRAAFEAAGPLCAHSVFDGLISARILSHDSYALRRALHALVAAVREAPPPRVWEM